MLNNIIFQVIIAVNVGFVFSEMRSSHSNHSQLETSKRSVWQPSLTVRISIYRIKRSKHLKLIKACKARNLSV